MRGFIIYSKEDVDKNRIFIEMLQNEFKQHDIELELVISEQYNYNELPDFALNRSRDYKISESFELHQIPVFNRAEVTRLANNKAWTYNYLRGTVPFMEFEYKGETYADEQITFPYVLKGCEGHGGNQVFMIEDEEHLKKALNEIGSEEYIKQRCASDLGKDVRVYILGNKIRAAVLRTSDKSFKSNFSLGGNVQNYNLNQEEKTMVENILKVFPIDYGGIDFIFDKGKAVFNEIEDAVGARMLYQVSDIDIVKEYAGYIISKLKQKETG